MSAFIRLGAFCFGLLGFVAGQTAMGQEPTMQLSAGVHLIRAEVANTEQSRMQGLMFRKSLGPNEGMLFVFQEDQRHCMWMKNTYVPLSVAFIDGKGVIVSIHDMEPQTEESHCAAAPTRYALEMSKGWFRAKGIVPGMVLRGLERAPGPQ